MPHKFKIGDNLLSVRPHAQHGTITGLMPVTDGQQPEYRIKHFSEDFERVALECELSAAFSPHR